MNFNKISIIVSLVNSTQFSIYLFEVCLYHVKSCLLAKAVSIFDAWGAFNCTLQFSQCLMHWREGMSRDISKSVPLSNYLNTFHITLVRGQVSFSSHSNYLPYSVLSSVRKHLHCSKIDS